MKFRKDVQLRATVIRSGVLLGFRQFVGICLSFVGLLLATRVIGPTAYGSYVTAFSIHQFAVTVAQLGVEAYLVRGTWQIEEREYDVASSALLLIGCAIAVFEATCVTRIGALLGAGQHLSTLWVFALSLPFQLVTASPLARLDRSLEFGRVAAVELTSLISYYLVAAPLALQGWGAWSLATGWLVQQTLSCILYHVAAGWLPRPAWDNAVLKRMLGYAISYSVAGWLWQVRGLVNPLIVAPLLGVEAVGFVNLAARIVEVLTFTKNVIWRISIASFARLQDDRRKLTGVIGEGSELQTIAAGLPLVLFSGLGPEITHVVLGARWAPAQEMFPFIAVASLTQSLFALHNSALSVLKRNWQIAIFCLAHVALLAIAAAVLVPLYGLYGYGYAEMIAAGAYIILDLETRRTIGAISYRFALPWYAVMALVLLVRPFGPWSVAIPFVVLAWPGTWSRLLSYVRVLKPARFAG